MQFHESFQRPLHIPILTTAAYPHQQSATRSPGRSIVPRLLHFQRCCVESRNNTTVPTCSAFSGYVANRPVYFGSWRLANTIEHASSLLSVCQGISSVCQGISSVCQGISSICQGISSIYSDLKVLVSVSRTCTGSWHNIPRKVELKGVNGL
jgi:hypothetical protein